MPLVCTHCSDSSGFFWVRCFGTRCASLCKRARPAPPGVRPVYFRLARNFFLSPPPPPAPRPDAGRLCLSSLCLHRAALWAPAAPLAPAGPTLGSRGAWGTGPCVIPPCPVQKRGKKKQSPCLAQPWHAPARGWGEPPTPSIAFPPASPVHRGGEGGKRRQAALPGKDLLRRWVAVSSWITVRSGGARKASSGDGESLPWQLLAAHHPRRHAERRAARGCCPIDPRPPAAPAASSRPGRSWRPLCRAPLPALGDRRGPLAASVPVRYSASPKAPRACALSASSMCRGSCPGAPKPWFLYLSLRKRPCGLCTLELF